MSHFSQPVKSIDKVGNHTAKCKYCDAAVSSSVKATSNLKRHLEVSFVTSSIAFIPSQQLMALHCMAGS